MADSEPDHAPTPFSAAQIRDGCRAGRVSTFLVETAGGPPVHQTFRFLEADERGALLEVSQFTPEGEPLGEPRSGRSTWEEFRSHASFPEDSVLVTQERVRTPAGTFACRLYTVTARRDGKTVVRRLHFADRLPGMPVRMVQEVDGRQVFSMTLVEHRDGRR